MKRQKPLPGQAEWLIAVLNGAGRWHQRREERATLRRWVEEWIGHDRNLQEVPDVLNDVNRFLARYHQRLAPCGLEELSMPEGRESLDYFIPKEGRKNRQLAAFDLRERTGNRPYLVSYFAWGDDTPAVAHWFAEFLSGSQSDDLQPCGRPRCDKYFLRAGKRTKYCTPACARHDTAVRAKQKRRQELTEERLKTARRVCTRFRKSWPEDWRERIAERVGVKRNWVSRQINLGNLTGPPIRTGIKTHS